MYKDEHRTTEELRRKEDIMSRVRTVGGLRTFMGSPMAGACLAAIFLVVGAVVVSVRDVVSNIMAQAEWGGRFSYTYSSLMHSRMIVQVLAFFIVMSCGLILFRSVRHLRNPFYWMGNFIVTILPLRFFRS
jgi:hypothetical protein